MRDVITEASPPPMFQAAAKRPWSVFLLCLGLLASLSAVAEFVSVTRQRVPAQSVQGTYPSPPSIVALGMLTPGTSVLHVSAPSSNGEALVKQLFVRENDEVREGQVLGTLDSLDRLQAAVALAASQVAARRSALARTSAGNSAFQITAQGATVERLRAEADRERQDYLRYEALHQEALISNAEWELHAGTYHAGVAALHEAEATLARTVEVRPVDLSVGRADLNSAEASLHSANVDLKQAFLRAPVAGTVLHIYAWPGERVGEGGVLDLGPTAEAFAAAEVYETDIRAVHINEAATVTSPALPESLQGRVSFIGQAIGRQQVVGVDPAANTDARVATVRVRLDPRSRAVAHHFINLQVRVEFGH